MIKCHICGIGTDFNCQQCNQPVCEDCCVQPTYMNQIDYALCNECNDSNETDRERELQREWEIEEAIKIKKEKKALARKKAYWTPEAIEKRKIKKVEKLKKEKEEKIKIFTEVNKTMHDIFKGMF